MTEHKNRSHGEKSVLLSLWVSSTAAGQTHRKSPIWLQRIIYTQPHYHPSHIYYTSSSLWLTTNTTITVGWGNINSFLPHSIWIGYRHNESFVRVQKRLSNGWEKQHPINEQSETEFNWLKLHFMWWYDMPVVIGEDKTCFVKCVH